MKDKGLFATSSDHLKTKNNCRPSGSENKVSKIFIMWHVHSGFDKRNAQTKEECGLQHWSSQEWTESELSWF